MNIIIVLNSVKFLGAKPMKEKVFIQIYKDGEYITSQDVTVFTISQVAENMRIKETYGLDCNLKRVFFKEEV